MVCHNHHVLVNNVRAVKSEDKLDTKDNNPISELKDRVVKLRRQCGTIQSHGEH